MTDRITEIENAGMAEAERHKNKYPDATEDYLIGRRDGYIAALTDMDADLYGEEIERLKEVIKDAWWVHSYGSSNNLTNTSQYDAKWEQFKKENNL